jgi:prephenate dehydrogenase
VRTVAIYGVGLIGGSFALALRKAGYDGRIVGVSSPVTIARALELGVIDEGAPPLEAASRADLVFVAQPIRVIIETIRQIAPYVRSNAVVTDVGSTKAAIVAAASEHLPAGVFVGGHPMAGKEERGVEAACAELFQRRVWAFTPIQAGDLTRTEFRQFLQWVERIGALPVVLDASEHDRTVALTSHLPQLASTALAAMLQDTFTGGPPTLHGPGLADMTRLALSSFDIWADIFDTNRQHVTTALEAWLVILLDLRAALANGRDSDIRSIFARAELFASSLRTPRTDSQDNLFTKFT